MASLLFRLGSFAARKAWTVIISWVVILGLGVAAFLTLSGTLSNSFDIPGTASGAVTDQLAEKLPDTAGGTGTVVYRTDDGSAFTDEQKQAISDLAVSGEDLDLALEELGEFVDVTRDELERIILATEQHALQRSLGGITAASVMSKDVQFVSPDTTLQQAWKLLDSHHVKTLPVVQDGALVGIVSLSDLVGPAMQQARLSWRGLFGRKPVRMAQVMSRRVVSVSSQPPLERLLPLLCEQGLHCLPVLDGDVLVGVVTQTDLIAGLKRQLLSSANASERRIPAL